MVAAAAYGAHLDDASVRNATGDYDSLTLPDASGSYELRAVADPEEVVEARRTIQVSLQSNRKAKSPPGARGLRG